MKACSDQEEEEEEDDFDEVPEKEGYEPHIPEHLRAEYGEFHLTHTHTRASSPTHTRAQIVRLSYKRRPAAAAIIF